MPAVDRARIAQALPRYTLGDQLGSGSFGLVIAGHHQDLDRPVAIKVLSAALAADFRAEARMLSRLDHPHIVRIYDYVAQDDLCLLIMELLGGGSLAQHRLRAEATLAVGVAVADALAHAHAHGVAHRDIKPDNILFTETGQPKLTDFGIGRLFEAGPGTTSGIVGTPKYMAPEQIAGGPVGPAADLYALGAVLYELVAGRSMFDPGLSVPELLRHQCEVDPPPLEGVPPAVAAVILRALAKAPAERQRDARELVRDLSEAAAGLFGPDWRARSGLVVRLTESVGEATLGGGSGTIHRFSPPPRGTGPGAAGPAVAGPAAAGMPATAGPPGVPVRDAREAPDPPPSPDVASGAGPAAAAGTPVSTGTATAPGRNLFEGTPYGRRSRLTGRRAGAVALVAVVAVAVIVAAVLTLGRGGGGPAADGRPGGTPTPPTARTPAPVTLQQIAAWAVAPSGGFYVVDSAGTRLLRLDPAGKVSLVAGTGVPGSTGDGGPALQARLRGVRDVAVDGAGNIYLAEERNDRIRRVGRDGVITTVAGGGATSYRDGLPATSVALSVVSGPIAADLDGQLYLAGAGRIYRVDRTGVIRLIARAGSVGSEPATPEEAAVPVVAAGIGDVEVRAGRVYVADYTTSRIQVLEPDGSVRTLAGTGREGFSGDGGPGPAADLNLSYRPSALALDAAGDLYFPETVNHRVRRVDTRGIITTVAGSGELGTDGNGGPALNARLWGPERVAVDAAGVLYLGESGVTVRRVGPDGIITEFPG
ncbi:serine/threonine-protein kinase [Frankia sp. Mgl5]|uniref:serine/threonine-protein kinase n=1 Tax=Frankia sp. Mgl5 TaxID=2933793 RepID=UPI00200D7703|nr:serine/threonine-protein kinase [Frankia sp. Mgl5]MCK9931927.1 serine/threonine-protein kinase [Frankia sp. Mgl5]